MVSKESFIAQMIYQSKYKKENCQKLNIPIPLFVEEEVKISTRTQIIINLNTGHMNISNCLRGKRLIVYPTKVQRRDPNNPEVLQRYTEIFAKNCHKYYTKNSNEIIERKRINRKEKALSKANKF